MTPKVIPVVFHNDSNYDHNFIIKRTSREKYITFSVPIKKEPENGKSITWKIKFIDSVRFMSRSLSGLADNLSEELHKDKCKGWSWRYITAKNNTRTFKCVGCDKKYEQMFDKDLANSF